jgi:hypothetical protein
VVKFCGFAQNRDAQMGGFKRALWEQPSPSSGQGAVRNNNLFHASYHTIRLRRPIWGTSAIIGIMARASVFIPPNAKILHRVDIHVLAERSLVTASTAFVGACRTASKERSEGWVHPCNAPY